MIITIRAQCNCGSHIGVHCGDRRYDGSGRVILSGKCDSDIIYQCPAANVPATEKGVCSYCAKSEKIGADYCSIGRAGNLYLFFNKKII